MQILLVEDDILLADGLRTALKREGFAVNHVATGKQALTTLATDKPEILILDLGLPDMDGLAVLKRLRAGDHAPQVLILTARDATEDKVSGLDLGADDYLVKPFEMPELLARLRALERRTGGVKTSSISNDGVVLDTLAHSVSVDGEALELPRREYMLLKALMENPGRVLSRETLEEKLYGWGEELASNSIEVHIHHLRKKIRADFIKTVRGVGYSVSKT
ncbi:response regulator transcription factor [Gammaproteobacteria bacterium]|nr:response regulator transcription factor [Gammaproteobacteria bacterium]